jgi:hypothetical protein
MKAKTIRLSKIKPYAGNPRLNAEAVRAVRTSIERFGYQVPIVVDPDNVIITGHTRYLALQELGWKEVEVIEANLPKALAAEFRIVDNRTSELAEWDRDRLVDELRAVDDQADIKAFFRDGELDRLFAQGGGIAVQHPTQDQIDKAAQEASTKFEEMAKESEAALVQHCCRSCGRNFLVR